jgi:hypothetical protein
VSRRASYPLLLAVLTVVWSCAPAFGAIRPSDSAATHAYFEAELARRHTKPAGASLAVIHELASQLKTECPGVLANAPLPPKHKPASRSGQAIEQELFQAPFRASEAVEHPARVRFERTVLRLRWSNPQLTKLLHSLAIESALQSAIPPPHLCADFTAWVASDYTTVPTETMRYLHDSQVVSETTLIEPEPHEQLTLDTQTIVERRLKPYENRADRRLARELAADDSKALNSPALPALFTAVEEVYVAVKDPGGVLPQGTAS